jgi:hypothetical protein
MENISEYYGSVTKVEHLWCIEEMGLPSTCILEARDAYPGYYGHIRGFSRPRLIFIMSNQPCTLEQVTRMTAEVKKGFHHAFSAACCTITMASRAGEGVRIKGIDDYDVIRELQMAYADKGLDLKKKEGKIENEEGLIKVRKFFRMKEVSEDIFLDAEEATFGYFKIPEDLAWDRFKQAITRVRGNWKQNSFDAAKCFIYKGGEITDMVRIYSKEVDHSFLVKLRDAFLRASEW